MTSVQMNGEVIPMTLENRVGTAHAQPGGLRGHTCEPLTTPSPGSEGGLLPCSVHIHVASSSCPGGWAS